ncbi:Ribosomal lysine N-methyltransferase 4 [Knufia fluminis]|uniref:Ribosomal lysine N-methyltransferase 4 n=1 Tax=Knufia fluminis TaxID=191047 RepID=A0AAN8I3J0_9EURO|nr:Ribosomal lysine N-methyltransferase 4 [Knufia fluminis]
MADSVDFEEASASFLEWFTSQPGTSFHPSLKIVDLRDRDAGRGIVATADIPQDTDLFTIPRSSIISVETSELARKLPELFEDPPDVETSRMSLDDDSHNELSDAPVDLPMSWLNLILILLYESLHYSSSKWAPYLSVLPSTPSQFDTLMFWTEEELAELQASAMTTKIGKDSADSMFKERIIPVVREHANVFYPSGSTPLNDEELLQKCHVIGSLIMSYAFDLQPDEDEEAEDENEDGWVEDQSKPSTMGMVPMADMLNADAEFNAHLSHGDDALTMTSLREIKAGEEVLNYYGPLPNGELLRRYGYTTPKHARYDVVEIGWNLVKQVLEDNEREGNKRRQMQKLLEKVEQDEDMDVQEGFQLERETEGPNDQGLCDSVAKFTKFPDDLVEVITAVMDEMLKYQNEGKNIEDRTRILKMRTLTILRAVTRKRLEQYATSREQDEDMLKKGEGSGRMKHALTVRIGEKLLLKDAGEWAEQALEKYSADVADSSSQPARKKQKRER